MMINANQLIAIFQSAIAVILLLVIGFCFWPALRLDIFRQKMFALRDEMFDYAAAGNISFSDPAYRLLRQSMNGFIRYGHRLSFFSLCMTIFQWKKLGVVPDKSWNTQWESAIGKVREESARKALLDYHARTELLVAERVVFSSPLLLAVIFSVWCGALLHMSWRGLRNATNKAATVMMAKIVDPSLLDEEAARLAVA